jgi:CheY-like chemotaxis protein
VPASFSAPKTPGAFQSKIATSDFLLRNYSYFLQLKTPAKKHTILCNICFEHRFLGQKPKKVTPLDYHRGTETILVVDDEESLRAVVGDLLGQLGYTVLSAGGSDEAMALSAGYDGKIDLLLSDVIMEPVPGPALAERLIAERPEMKVVFISGYADDSLAPDRVLKPGAVLVQKPFTIKILSAKLREVLERPAV